MTAAQIQKLVDAFDWDGYAESFGGDYEAIYREILLNQGAATARLFGFDFDPGDATLSRAMTDYVGERIKQLTATSKDNVIDLIRRVLDKADDSAEAGTTRELGDQVHDAVIEQFDGYAQWRADRIARTETAIAYNHGTLMSSKQAGYTEFDVADGDDDEDCAQADGEVWTLEECLAEPIAHPNCTRVFAPHDPEDEE